MSAPYLILDDAEQRIGKAIVNPDGTTQVAMLGQPLQTYSSITEAKAAAGGNWFAVA